MRHLYLSSNSSHYVVPVRSSHVVEQMFRAEDRVRAPTVDIHSFFRG
jgi:hypothetical protein